MDPRAEKKPGLHLPEPSMGKGDFLVGSYEDIAPKQEIGLAAAPEARGVTSSLPPIVSTSPPTVPVQTSDPQASAQSAISNDTVGDELDKEWVSKAKMIVEKTKDDPYQQSHEIGKVKADYLRIRFNKHIKVAQDKRL